MLKYIDLCSGIGGFRVAIESLKGDFKCILSADIKQDAIDVYNANFNETNEKVDINTLDPGAIGAFDLLCAGFPCQPFSSAGQKKGFSDTRGGIIFKILEICKYHKPKYVLLENVYNLMTLDNGKCIARIKQLFEELGYFVNYEKFNSCDFGCPQSRERVYIVCSLNKAVSLTGIVKGQKTFMKDVIDTSVITTQLDPTFVNKLIELHQTKPLYGCQIGDKRGGSNNIHSWDIGLNGTITRDECELMNQIMLQRRKKRWAVEKDITWMDGMPLTFTEISTFHENTNLQQMLDHLVELNYLRFEKCKELVDGKRHYKLDSEEGYNICKGKLSFPISRILDPNGVSPTLTATDSNKLAVLVGGVVRPLTANEMKKVCGFPESFIIPKHVNYYNLFGNMATPPVITAILLLLFSEDTQTP
tara:strand:- start:1159 stop:2409 length:1251 start_codon:yes stop_codon:yes gene_type:complete